MQKESIVFNMNKSNSLSNISLSISIFSLFYSFYGLIGLLGLILSFICLAKNNENTPIRRKALISLTLSLISLIYAYCIMSASLQ